MRFAIEELFERWGRWVARHAPSVVAVTLALTIGLGSGLGDLELDTTSRGFLHDDDPIQLTYEAYRAKFGRDVDILIVLEPRDGFSLRFLETLGALHADLVREVPLLESVTSLANAPAIHPSADETTSASGGAGLGEPEDAWMPEPESGPWVGTLRDRWPRSEKEVREFVAGLRADALYRDRLIAVEEALTTLVLKTQPYTNESPAGGSASTSPRSDFITGEEDAAIVAAVDDVVARYASSDLDVHVVGAPVFAVELQHAMRRDMAIFTVLALSAIATLLFALFRRAAGVLLPLGVVGLSVTATLGAMALLGTPIRVPTQVLPSFLLAVGVCGSVHLLVQFLRHYDAGVAAHEAVAYALSHSGLAILLTGLTTAAGLVSFLSAEIAPIAEFGGYGALGVLIGLLYTLVLLPAALVLLPPKRLAARAGRSRGATAERVLIAVGRTATRRPWWAVGSTVLLIAVGAWGIGRISLSHDPLLWLPSTSDTRRSAERVDEAFHGTMSLEIVISTERDNGLLQPDLVRRIDALEHRLRGLEVGNARVGQVFSAVDTLKAWRVASGPDSATLPVGREALIADVVRYRAVGGEELSEWIGSGRRTARISVRVPWMDAVRYPPLIAAVKREVRDALGGSVQWEITGATAVMSQTINAVMNSLIRSYLIALALITPLMILMIGNLRQGLITMVPNLVPIGLTLGVMGWAGIPMDVFTLLVGCIAIGLAVDDTIHFMHGFRSAHLRSGSVDHAVDATLRTTGRAILFTSLVLATGFMLYAASSMENLRNFGMLIALAIGLAFLADVFLAPALLKLAYGSSRNRAVMSTPEENREPQPLEPQFQERLRACAARQGCEPLWLQRRELPVFETHDLGERGPRIVLLHGLFGAMSNWDQAFPALAKFGRVSALNLPLLDGDRSEITVQALAVYVEAFLRSRGSEPAVLCGNSMGGHIALRVALHAPGLVKGLVLTGSSGLYEHEPSQMPLRPDESFVREQMHRVFFSDCWVTEEGIQEIAAIFRERRYFLSLIQAARSARRDNLQQVLPRIETPTLLLWGDEDQITPLDVARTFEALMPNAELVTVSRCGHAPMIEAAEWFGAEVERFVLGLARRGDGVGSAPDAEVSSITPEWARL
ncbi:MAG: alpha/beta fold hydrolase [Gammaproteobacteria bacterium]|nr:alpha/beta fold hydrolase [Gammaproteobacteria bacterium]NIR83183.1 alpha/beta fold hydrolase [Gammaproteobacteria bacterium]NIR90991.1 alpha/beta fold hydrolase [Gammaproteobacteria bacterium]NIU04348.1 alpha/beta fold hydrolase [Gammaproteobacteria bacterium]NIV52571.1 alpha/beta fold hydrolase [Gammaproteobacteria bacterium]